MVCTTLAIVSRAARSTGRRTRGDRQRQADAEPERQRGHADQHMAAEIIRQPRQGVGKRGSRSSPR